MLAAGIGLEFLHSQTAIAAPLPQQLTAEQALKRLLDGNDRYTTKGLIHPDQTTNRRLDVAIGQRPFAMILGCADSRVPPEIVFDQGLGDLFVIRVAGNILDDAILGSIEYAAEVLQVPLVFVLGHERCGAVSAAVKRAPVPGHISTLIQAIQPAVDRSNQETGDKVDNVVRANIKFVVEEMRNSSPIGEFVKQDKLKIVGGRYDLDTGTVELIA